MRPPNSGRERLPYQALLVAIAGGLAAMATRLYGQIRPNDEQATTHNPTPANSSTCRVVYWRFAKGGPMLPDYISKAVPNPTSNRGPWYANTAPSYAGIFLWIAFYLSIAKDTIPHAGVGLCMAAIVVAGLLSYALYYYAPAMLGLKTGYPLYVVGSSTFGTAGGYVMPGLLMG